MSIIQSPREKALLITLNQNRAIYLVHDNSTKRPQELLQWFNTHFPIAWWGRVKWEDINNSVIQKWVSTNDLKKFFKKIMVSNNLKGSVFIFWSNANLSTLEMDLQTAFDNIEPIVEIDWDTWIFSPEEGWCIEIYHEGEICFGYSPNHKKT